MSLLQDSNNIINQNNKMRNSIAHNIHEYYAIQITNDTDKKIITPPRTFYKKCSFTLLTSPAFVQTVGYVFFVIVVCTLHYTIDTNDTNNFLSWGVPVKIFNYNIETNTEFYILLTIFFIHELINAWVSQVVYPWIINSVQDSKCKKIKYSNITCLLIINANNIYGTLDIVFIISSINSQVSFLLAIILAQVISSTIINYRYLLAKLQ